MPTLAPQNLLFPCDDLAESMATRPPFARGFGGALREDEREYEETSLSAAIEPILKILNSQNKKRSAGRGALVAHPSFISFDAISPEQVASMRIGEKIVQLLRAQGLAAEHEIVIHDQGRHMEYFGSLMVKEAWNDGKDAPIFTNHIISRYARDNAGLCVTFRKQPAYLAYLISKKIVEFEMKPEVRRHGIKVDSWFSEKRLYRGPESDLLEILDQRRLLRWSIGVPVLKSCGKTSLFDIPLVEQNGEPTEAFSAMLYSHHALGERGFSIIVFVSDGPEIMLDIRNNIAASQNFRIPCPSAAN